MVFFVDTSFSSCSHVPSSSFPDPVLVAWNLAREWGRMTMGWAYGSSHEDGRTNDGVGMTKVKVGKVSVLG